MDFEQMNNNKVTLSGEVVTEPKFSHEMYGEGFYEFDLKVKRLSNSYDVIPVTVSERLLNENDVKLGAKICGKGQFRSYNKLDENKSKLMLTMFLREFLPYDKASDINVIEITGYVCKDPIYRTTPFKREICDLLLAVNRNYNKSDYLPCIAWGRNAKYVKNFSVGDKVNVIGRVQSREYQKKLDNDEIVTKTAFEVSLSKISLENDSLEYVEKVKTSMGEIDNYYQKRAIDTD